MKPKLSTCLNNLLKIIASLLPVFWILSGCAMVGPKSISMGRADYNEAINKTEDEQLLLALVKGRYGEISSLMAVSGVAANIRFGSSAGTQIGIGSGDTYQGNLVPFSAGLIYEENPTITYVPIHGERYLHQLLTPVSLKTLVLLIRGAKRTQTTYLTMLASRINELQNPDFMTAPLTESAARFQRLVELNKTLSDAGVLQWVEDSRERVPFDLMMADYAPLYVEEVREYLALLGLPLPPDTSETIILPVYFSIKDGDWGGMGISTRSTYDLIEILQEAIEVPEEHVAAGLTYPGLRPGLAGRNLHIHTSKSKPENCELSVRYRGYWYYIDPTDMHTKLFYRMVRVLWSVSIAAGVDRRDEPVLTIPVGR